MKVIECGSNLGDFLSSLPVFSGISKKFGKISLILKSDGKIQIKGIKEFLLYQEIFSEVLFDSEIENIDLTYKFVCSGLSRISKNSEFRPIETCKYENYFKDKYKLEFDVDDNYIVKVPELNLNIDKTSFYCGDRWSQATDRRRDVEILSKFNFLKFLDYSNTLLENAYIIKYCNNPFITTFTGIATLSNLLNKKTIVICDEGVRNWNGQPLDYTCQCAFYLDRNIKFLNIEEFNKQKIIDLS